MRGFEMNFVLALLVTVLTIQVADCWHRWHGHRYPGQWHHWDDGSGFMNHQIWHGVNHNAYWHNRRHLENSSPYRWHGRWRTRHWGNRPWTGEWKTPETGVQAETSPPQGSFDEGRWTPTTWTTIPRSTVNPFLRNTTPATVMAPPTTRPTTTSTSTTKRPTVATAPLSTTEGPYSAGQFRFGGEVPREAATADWDEYENTFKDKYEDEDEQK